MMDFDRIAAHALQSQPYAWAKVDALFSGPDCASLSASYPNDHYKTIAGYGGEKDYEYEARALIAMKQSTVCHADSLSQAWRTLAEDLCSDEYRRALSRLTGIDLMESPMEANVFHYGPGAHLGPHLDLPEKIVTHVLYFNSDWNPDDGGCLQILASADPADIVHEIQPVVGSSAVLVRSDQSWHAVRRVARDSPLSRRSMTVTFYKHGSTSSMWPENDTSPLHSYEPPMAL